LNSGQIYTLENEFGVKCLVLVTFFYIREREREFEFAWTIGGKTLRPKSTTHCFITISIAALKKMSSEKTRKNAKKRYFFL
jgi:hypothetical protein